jgi:hypothetical protein
VENENFFSVKMINKSSDELQKIASNEEEYVDEARLAAVWELEKRKESNDEVSGLKESIQIELEKGPQQQRFNNDLPKDIPRTVKWAVYLIYTSWLVGVLQYFLQMSIWRTTYYVGGNSIIIFIFLASLGLITFFVNKIIRKRNWARIVYSALQLFGVAQFVYAVAALSVGLPLNILADLIRPLLAILIIILLFLPESNRWYSNESKKSTNSDDLLDSPIN